MSCRRLSAKFGVLFFFLFLSIPSTRADGFSYSDFSSTAGLTLTGAATQQGSMLRLTPDATYQQGSAWYTEQMSVQNGFTTQFQFQVTNTVNQGVEADGIWFLVQTAGLLGGRDTALEANSVWIEFDTYQNPWDPNGNHIAVMSCGASLPSTFITDHLNGCTQGINANLPVTLADGSVHTSNITYLDGEMGIALDGTQVLNVPINLNAINLNNGNAWVGFATTTGDGAENNDILSWSFRSSPAPVPEPATLGMLAAGLVGIALLRKRVRAGSTAL